MNETEKKNRLLEDFMRQTGNLVISFSGGFDSYLLCAVAKQFCENCVAVLVDAPFVARSSVKRAHKMSFEMGIKLVLLSFPVSKDNIFWQNRHDRCYICKTGMADIITDFAHENGFSAVADGVNLSDLSEFRPGLKAVDSAGFLHPFVEAGMTKEDLKALASTKSLKYTDIPSDSCLMTRFRYGEHVTPEKLRKIENAEDIMHEFGFCVVRVMYESGDAVVKLPDISIERLKGYRREIVSSLLGLGFKEVRFDHM